jgi:hypothetical protein
MAEWQVGSGIRNSGDVRLPELAGEQWGVVSVAELRGLGFSRQAILRRERSGRLIRLYRGTYAVGHVSERPEIRWIAAAKAARGWLSHHSAGEHFEFLDLEHHWPDVTVTGNRRIPRIRIHRTRCLPPQDTTRHRNIPVTTPARTLVDLAGVLTETALRHAVRRAQGLRRLNLHQLVKTMDRLGPRRGSATLRKVIATGPAPTRSVIEDVLLDLFLDAGLEHPDVNKPMHVSGRRVVPDFRWPKQQLIVEAGITWHDRTLDAERRARLEAAGERVVQITWEQAILDPGALIRLLPSLQPR